jgi:hypothetical protein
MNKFVCLKYVEGSITEVEITSIIPADIRIDYQNTKVWWQIGSSWCGRIQIGKHLLNVSGDTGPIDVNLGVPGAVIGIYDLDDPEQVVAMQSDSEEALKKRKEQSA